MAPWVFNAVIDYLPSPLDIDPTTGFKPGDEENEIVREHSDETCNSALRGHPIQGLFAFFGPHLLVGTEFDISGHHVPG